MGQLLSCERCPTAVTHSVITFSDDLVLKITEGIEPEPLTSEELKRREFDDYEWFEMLKCLDNSHSEAYGLSMAGFNAIINRLNERLKAGQVAPACDYQELIKCYQEHPQCTMECNKMVEEYVNCIEGKTLGALIHRMEQDKIRAQKSKTIKNK